MVSCEACSHGQLDIPYDSSTINIFIHFHLINIISITSILHTLPYESVRLGTSLYFNKINAKHELWVHRVKQGTK